MISALIISQKTVSGWLPVVPKNLHAQPVDASLKQKSRRVAAPRRSTDGPCKKPPTNMISLARCSVTRTLIIPLVKAVAAAQTVPLLSRHTVHLQTGAYNIVRDGELIATSGATSCFSD